MPKSKAYVFSGKRWDGRGRGEFREKQLEDRWKMIAFEILAQLEEERAKKK